MPSRWGAELRCTYCGLTYRALRTGDTFASIKDEIAGAAGEPSTWRYRRRNGVLGWWHAKKLLYWEYHVRLCESAAQEHQHAQG